ncbi:MAG: epoxide hydrolase 4, partial [Acidobacteriota bacterium]|nr:epoxide hydrolase 4 [Acidobacteriota bacterium]
MSPVELSFTTEGDGALVVLLHGFPEFRYSWRKQIPPLAAAGFQVVAPDLRGYNLSPKPRKVSDYALLEIVGDVAALIERLGGAPCIVVGHDWGGLVAWFLAMTRPDLVRRLVILNIPHPIPYSRELRRSREQKLRAAYQLFFALPVLPVIFMKLFGGRMLRRMGKFTAEEIRTYRRAWRGSLKTMLHYYGALRTTRGQLRPRIRRIDIPVLMIWGENEQVFIRATTEDFDEWVTDLRIERIPGAGHFVQTDAAERVNELL